MKRIAIVAEYNPIHTGHQYMLTTLRAQFPDAAIYIIMSGSFVQRGEPALFDKWHRASWAIACGADCVIELPAVYALSSAEAFADGAVQLAARLGCHYLSCGVEKGRPEEFYALAKALLSLQAAHPMTPTEKTYGQQLSAMIGDVVSPDMASLLASPNALLAVHYVKAMEAHQFPMTFYPIYRLGQHDTDDLTAPFTSASALRRHIIENRDVSTVASYIPEAVYDDVARCIDEGQYTDYTRYGDIVLYQSRISQPKELATLAAFTEGLENRWHRCLMESTSWDDALQQLKTKRYAYRRLCRMGAYTTLRLTQHDMDEAYQHGPAYGRILALSHSGAASLKEIKKNLPLITKVRPALQTLSPYARRMLHYDLMSTDIHALCFHNVKFRRGLSDYYTSPIIK